MEQIDDYIVIEFVENKCNNKYYKVRCSVCGHEKNISLKNMKSQSNFHSQLNCKEDYYKENIGKIFGDYECINYYHKNNQYFQELKCVICGHVLSVDSGAKLNRRHCASLCKDEYYKSLLGQQFGDLEIVEKIESNRYSCLDKYKCRCVRCGVYHNRQLRSILKGIHHGAECEKQLPNDVYKKAIFQRYNSMYQRCNNPNNPNYVHYGAKGIKLLYDSPLELYNDFYDLMVEFCKTHPLSDCSFDRIDVNGNYEKNNLRLATQKIQSTNTTRKKRFIITDGKETILSDSGNECGRYLKSNGRAILNMVNGRSKTSSGYRFVRFVSDEEDLQEVIKLEGVTTNLIVSKTIKEELSETLGSVVPCPSNKEGEEIV